jgi:hypothetical protein
MEREFYFLLPDGINTVDSMKEGCEKLTEQTGHTYSSHTFRNLLRKGVIKKLTRINYDIIANSDVRNNETEGNASRR